MRFVPVTINSVKIMKKGKEVWQLGPALYPFALSFLI